MNPVFLVPNSVNQIANVLSVAVVFVIISETMSLFETIVDMRLYRWGNGLVLSSMFIFLLLKANHESIEQSGLLSVLGGGAHLREYGYDLRGIGASSAVGYDVAWFNGCNRGDCTAHPALDLVRVTSYGNGAE